MAALPLETPVSPAGPADNVPHYQLPNFASILGGYINAEADVIREAYSASNFTSIRKIPNEVRPGEIIRARQQTVEDNRKPHHTLTQVQELRRKGVTRRGYFQEFEYVPSRYSLSAELRTKERLESEAKRLNVGGKDFIPSGATAKFKYEDGFEDKEFRFPYMGDPFEAAQDQRMRAKWIEDSKILHGPFVPPGKAKGSARPTRVHLPEIVKGLHKIVTADWADYDFQVLATEDDNVAVRFDLVTVESQVGLLAYMNILASQDSTVGGYGLQKVVEDWNTKPGDGYLYFMFRPPWVHARTTDAYFTLHPEERNYITSAASSMKVERGGASTKK